MTVAATVWLVAGLLELWLGLRDGSLLFFVAAALMLGSAVLAAAVPERKPRPRVEVLVDEALVADIVEDWMGHPPMYEGSIGMIEFEDRLAHRLALAEKNGAAAVNLARRPVRRWPSGVPRRPDLMKPLICDCENCRPAYEAFETEDIHE